MDNAKLSDIIKNDELYTQYLDVQYELDAYLDYDPDLFRGKTVLLPCDDTEKSNFTRFFAQNFNNLGLKKLISTSFVYESEKLRGEYYPSFFEECSLRFDENKTKTHGKIFTLSSDFKVAGILNVRNIKWRYLKGDGDFRSDEVKVLRDEADFIITNPPFSLFREFVSWIFEVDKKFIIVGDKNVITYKEIYPLIMENKMWSGRSEPGADMYFATRNYDDVDKIVNGVCMKKVPSVWLTNIEYGKRHDLSHLMKADDDFKGQ